MTKRVAFVAAIACALVPAAQLAAHGALMGRSNGDPPLAAAIRLCIPKARHAMDGTGFREAVRQCQASLNVLLRHLSGATASGMVSAPESLEMLVMPVLESSSLHNANDVCRAITNCCWRAGTCILSAQEHVTSLKLLARLAALLWKHNEGASPQRRTDISSTAALLWAALFRSLALTKASQEDLLEADALSAPAFLCFAFAKAACEATPDSCSLRSRLVLSVADATVQSTLLLRSDASHIPGLQGRARTPEALFEALGTASAAAVASADMLLQSRGHLGESLAAMVRACREGALRLALPPSHWHSTLPEAGDAVGAWQATERGARVMAAVRQAGAEARSRLERDLRTAVWIKDGEGEGTIDATYAVSVALRAAREATVALGPLLRTSLAEQQRHRLRLGLDSGCRLDVNRSRAAGRWFWWTDSLRGEGSAAASAPDGCAAIHGGPVATAPNALLVARSLPHVTAYQLAVSRFHASRGRGMFSQPGRIRGRERLFRCCPGVAAESSAASGSQQQQPPPTTQPWPRTSGTEAMDTAERQICEAWVAVSRLLSDFPHCPAVLSVAATPVVDPAAMDASLALDHTHWGAYSAAERVWIRGMRDVVDLAARKHFLGQTNNGSVSVHVSDSRVAITIPTVPVPSTHAGSDGSHSRSLSTGGDCIWAYDHSREDAVVWRHRGLALALAPRWPGMPPPLLASHQADLDRLSAAGLLALHRLAEPQHAQVAALVGVPGDLPAGVQPGVDLEPVLLDIPLQDLMAAATVSWHRASSLLRSDPRQAAEHAAMLAAAFPESTGLALLFLGEAHRSLGHFGMSVLLQAAMARWVPESAVGLVNMATNILGPVREASRATPVLSTAVLLMRAGLSRGEGSGGPGILDGAVSAAPAEVRVRLAATHRHSGPGTGWSQVQSPVPPQRVLLDASGRLCAAAEHVGCREVLLPVDAADGPLALTECGLLAERQWSDLPAEERAGCAERQGSARVDLWDDAVDSVPHSFVPGDWLWIMPTPGGVRSMRPVGRGHLREAGDMDAALRLREQSAPRPRARLASATTHDLPEKRCDWHQCSWEGRNVFRLQQRMLSLLTGTPLLSRAVGSPINGGTGSSGTSGDGFEADPGAGDRAWAGAIATVLRAASPEGCAARAASAGLDRPGSALLAIAALTLPLEQANGVPVCPWQVGAQAMSAANAVLAGTAPVSPAPFGQASGASAQALVERQHPLIGQLEKQTAALLAVSRRLVSLLHPARSDSLALNNSCDCTGAHSGSVPGADVPVAQTLREALSSLSGSAANQEVLRAWHDRMTQLSVVRSGEGDPEAALWHSAESVALSGTSCGALTATTAMNHIISGSRADRAASRLRIAAINSALLRLRAAQDAALLLLAEAADDPAARGALLPAPVRDTSVSLLQRLKATQLSRCEEERHFFLSYHGRGAGTALILQAFSAIVAPSQPSLAEHASRLLALQQAAQADQRVWNIGSATPRPHAGRARPFGRLEALLSTVPVSDIRLARQQCALRPAVARHHLSGYSGLIGVGIRSAVLAPDAIAAIASNRRTGSYLRNVRVALSGDVGDPFGNFSIGSGSIWWAVQAPVLPTACGSAGRACSGDHGMVEQGRVEASRPATVLSRRGVSGDFGLRGADLFDESAEAAAAAHRAWLPLPAPLSSAEQAALAAGVDPCLASGLRRARVGFLSRHFVSEHPHGHVLRAAIAGLHRSAFEVVLVRIGQDEHKLDAGVMAAADGVVDVRRISTEGTLAAVQALGLDALVFSEQLADPVAFGVGAHRSAPLQVVFGGDPTTSGHDNTVDYYVGGDRTEGDGPDVEAGRGSDMVTGAGLYTEQLLRLGGQGFSYSPAPRGAPADKLRNYSAFSLPVGGGDGTTSTVLIGCLQSAFKMSTLLDDIIAALLRSLPRAILVTVASRQQPWQARLEARWRRSMPDVVHRILVSPRKPPGDEFMGLLSCMDVVLHPAPFGGSRTAADALAVGAPLVALPSRLVSGRMARSLLVSARAPALLAQSPAHMVRLLAELASLPTLRARISAELVARAKLVWERQEVPLRWQLFLQTALHTPLADRRATRQQLRAVERRDRAEAARVEREGGGWLSQALQSSPDPRATAQEASVWGRAVSVRLKGEAGLFSAGGPVEAEWEL